MDYIEFIEKLVDVSNINENKAIILIADVMSDWRNDGWFENFINFFHEIQTKNIEFSEDIKIALLVFARYYKFVPVIYHYFLNVRKELLTKYSEKEVEQILKGL